MVASIECWCGWDDVGHDLRRDVERRPAMTGGERLRSAVHASLSLKVVAGSRDKLRRGGMVDRLVGPNELGYFWKPLLEKITKFGPRCPRSDDHDRLGREKGAGNLRQEGPLSRTSGALDMVRLAVDVMYGTLIGDRVTLGVLNYDGEYLRLSVIDPDEVVGIHVLTLHWGVGEVPIPREPAWLSGRHLQDLTFHEFR